MAPEIIAKNTWNAGAVSVLHFVSRLCHHKIVKNLIMYPAKRTVLLHHQQR
jgi:hypothetical protein